MALAEKIKQIRERNGMTQKQVAELMGISQQAYGQYESGSRKPKSETLQRIAQALNVRLYEFFLDDSCEKLPVEPLDAESLVQSDNYEVRLTSAADHVAVLQWYAESESGIIWSNRDKSDWLKKEIPTVARLYNVTAEDLRNALESDFEPEPFRTVAETWKQGAIPMETDIEETERRAFYELPNDWQKDTAINWQIEIIRKKMGKKYNNAMFEALMPLLRNDDEYSREFVERLESLLYGPKTAPEKK